MSPETTLARNGRCPVILLAWLEDGVVGLDDDRVQLNNFWLINNMSNETTAININKPKMNQGDIKPCIFTA